MDTALRLVFVILKPFRDRQIGGRLVLCNPFKKRTPALMVVVHDGVTLDLEESQIRGSDMDSWPGCESYFERRPQKPQLCTYSKTAYPLNPCNHVWLVIYVYRYVLICTSTYAYIQAHLVFMPMSIRKFRCVFAFLFAFGLLPRFQCVFTFVVMCLYLYLYVCLYP